MNLIPLASGSHANSTAVVDEGVCVIVDAGMKRLDILSRLVGLGVLTRERPEPDAVLISHEHGDHSKFVHQWKDTMICATGPTLEKFPSLGLKAYRVAHWAPVMLDSAVITACPVPHDAADPVCWRIGGMSGVAVVATDLGCIPKSMERIFEGATHVLLEANHSARMLAASDYNAGLVARIGGDLGHLSVEQACEFIRRMPASIKYLWLGHISKVANNPRLVRLAAELALEESGRFDVTLEVVTEKGT